MPRLVFTFFRAGDDVEELTERILHNVHISIDAHTLLAALCEDAVAGSTSAISGIRTTRRQGQERARPWTVNLAIAACVL